MLDKIVKNKVENVGDVVSVNYDLFNSSEVKQEQLNGTIVVVNQINDKKKASVHIVQKAQELANAINEVPAIIIYNENENNNNIQSIDSVISSSEDDLKNIFIYIDTADKYLSINIAANRSFESINGNIKSKNKLISIIEPIIKKINKDNKPVILNIIDSVKQDGITLSPLVSTAASVILSSSQDKSAIIRALNTNKKSTTYLLKQILTKVHDSSITNLYSFFAESQIPDAIGQGDILPPIVTKTIKADDLYYEFLNWAKDYGLIDMKNITKPIFEHVYTLIINNLREEERINRCIIEGDPGTGKTFTAGLILNFLKQKLPSVFKVPFTHIPITATTFDLNIISNTLLGTTALKGGAKGVETTVAYGTLFAGLKDVIQQAENIRTSYKEQGNAPPPTIVGEVTIFFNESNLSVGDGFDQVMRTIKDHNKIVVQGLNIPDDKIKDIKKDIKEKFGINAEVDNTSINVDLENLDGEGKVQARVITIETINKGLQYGGKQGSMATHDREIYLSVKPPDPGTDEGKEMIEKRIEHIIKKKLIPDIYLKQGTISGPDIFILPVIWKSFLSELSKNKESSSFKTLNKVMNFYKKVANATFSIYLALYENREELGFYPSLEDVIDHVHNVVTSLMSSNVTSFSAEGLIDKYINNEEEAKMKEDRLRVVKNITNDTLNKLGNAVNNIKSDFNRATEIFMGENGYMKIFYNNLNSKLSEVNKFLNGEKINPLPPLNNFELKVALMRLPNENKFAKLRKWLKYQYVTQLRKTYEREL